MDGQNMNFNGMDPNMMNNFNNMQMNPMMMNNMQMNPMMMNNMQMNPMMMNNMNNMGMNPMMMMGMNPMMFPQMWAANMPGGGSSTSSVDPNGWNLIFEKKNGSQTITVQISPDKKVSEAVNHYKIKSGIMDEEIKFIFNGKQLNQSLSISESGLINGSKITVISTKDVEGAN